MPYNYAMNPTMNQAAMTNPYMVQAPSPYQQSMMGRGAGSPYAGPMQAPRDTSFSDRQAAIGQQLAGQSGQNMGGTTAGMGSGLGGALGGADPKALAAGLRKLGDTVNPFMPGTQQATANQFGTDPYSQQNIMLAQQNQGLM